MSRITKVALWTARGLPLLAEVEDDEPEPYRRNLVGFHIRGTTDGQLGRSRDVGPSLIAQPDEEDEVEGLYVQEVEEEQDLEDESEEEQVI